MNDTLSGKRRLQLLLSSRSSSEIVLETSTGSILAAVGLYGNVLVFNRCLQNTQTPKLSWYIDYVVSDFWPCHGSVANSVVFVLKYRWKMARWISSFPSQWLFSSVSSQHVITNYGLNGAWPSLSHHSPTETPNLVFSVKRAKAMTVALWLFSSTVQLPYVANCGVYSFHLGKCICFVDSSPLAIIGIAYIVIPSVAVQNFYLKVYLALRARNHRV